ncbi:MAG TPA: hypothetical protein VGI05_10925 [Streptosporangiaceae bacterium]
MSAEPAPLLSLKAARTLYAALYGEFAPHPRQAAEGELSQDAYSLFYARSAAMGWLTPAREGALGGLWGMNDAEAGPGPGLQPSLAAFFQVTLTEPAEGRLLPVYPFLACAGDVVARLGTLRLDAIKVLLPEHGADADAHFASPSSMLVSRALLDALNWFGDCGPRQQVPVKITLDGLADPSIRTAASAIGEWVREINQEVFDCESWSEDDHVVLLPVTSFEGGPDGGHHRVTYRGTLAEWSLDALGWLAAFLADMSARHGVRTPLILTAYRTAG